MAYRVAENRVVAGLHYPMDSVAGQLLGITLAHHLLWAASDGKGFQLCASGSFKADDPECEPLLDNPLQASGLDAPKPSNLKATRGLPVLRWLFAAARREWVSASA